ncbi:MAG: nucleotidyltransferase domain-containing protein [Cyanobacteria bacterium]|nr:nucleotidyltransferase domain-containing protein [Cyanobacteriota bacterium]
MAVGVFGSYGRDTAGVGSDLDLLLILQHCEEPIWERLRRWDTPGWRRRCCTTPAGWGKCRSPPASCRHRS